MTNRLTAYSFFLISFLVIIMVFIGGITRLTGSGLSMTEWAPFTGFIPPLNHQDWVDLFTKYQQSPEFMHVNPNMDVEGFKGIFWLEFIHRVWGRLIGLAMLIPTFLVLKNVEIRKVFSGRLALLWLLGIAQGFMGWYMVKSGLNKDPHVSPYRLTMHLGLATLILWVSTKTGWQILHGTKGARVKTYNSRSLTMIFLITATILVGGLVAGLKAGLIYNTFPMMDDGWLPDAMWHLSPWWKNLFENAGTVQFLHRIFALTTFGIVMFLSYKLLQRTTIQTIKNNLFWIIGLAITQVSLGILTLVYMVPVSLGALHQVVAILLFTAAVSLRENLRIN